MNSLELLQEIFQYDFAVKALIVGILVSLCSALLGVTLVLKRYAMIGDGLSHVGFAALSIALVGNLAPLQVSIPIVVVAALLLLRLSERSQIKGDAGIALISSSALAIGVLVTSWAGGMNTDVYNYMFGSILAMSDSDVILSVIFSLIVLVLYCFCYQEIFAITFDEGFAKATGVRIEFLKLLLALLTAITVVVGMRMMGTLLISSLIVFPAVTAMLLFHGFRKVVIVAAILSVLCFLVGIMVSFLFDLPVGASVVAIHLVLFILFYLIRKLLKIS